MRLPSCHAFQDRLASTPFALVSLGLALLLVHGGAGSAVAQGTGVPDTIQVCCRVYHDLDQDGTRDPEDPPLPGVRLTNGLEIVSTDGQGKADLSVDRAIYRFVSLIIPAGFWAAGPWYHWVPRGHAGPDTVTFLLKDCPRTQADPIRFVHICDTQVYDWNYRLDEDLVVAGSLPGEPAFIVNTGDLVNVGADTCQWAIYEEMLRSSTLPFRNVVGNHELASTADPLVNFERYAGPPYYSFEAGTYHFVVYNCHAATVGTPRQDDWMTADLAAAPAGSRFLVFQHLMVRDMPSAQVVSWSGLGIRGVFSGHWHGINLSTTSYGVTEYNMNQIRGAPLDRTPKVLSVVDCLPDGEIEFDLRRFGADHRAELVHPGPGAAVRGSALEVIVQAYDTVDHAISVQASVTDGISVLGPVPLRAEGISLWRGEVDLSALACGPLQVQVTGSFAGGRTISLTGDCVREPSPPVPARLGTDWPMFRGNSRGTSFASEPLRPPLSLAWVQDTGGMVVLNSPVVADGRVFIGCRSESRTADAGLLACDARTGETLWRTRLRGGTALAPAVAGAVVIATALCDSVYGIDAATGEILWSSPTTYTRFDLTAPLVRDGMAWVSGKPWMYALETATGRCLWQSAYLGNAWFPYMYSCPCLGTSGYLYAGLFGLYPFSGCLGGLTILDPHSGALAVPIDNGAYRSPICSGDTIYYAGDQLHTTQRLTARGPLGSILWSAPEILGQGTGAPALGHGILVLAGDRGAIVAHRASDGQQLWSHPVGPPLYTMFAGTHATPAIADSVVYVGSLDGNLYALDLLSGGLLWQHHFGVPILSSAALSGNMLFVGASDGHVYAFTGLAAADLTSVRAPGATQTRFSFQPPYPNPAAGTCRFRWDLGRQSRVRISIYDQRGRRVRLLLDEPRAPGSAEIAWDLKDDLGRRVAAGCYHARLQADGATQTRRILIVR